MEIFSVKSEKNYGSFLNWFVSNEQPYQYRLLDYVPKCVRCCNSFPLAYCTVVKRQLLKPGNNGKSCCQRPQRFGN